MAQFNGYVCDSCERVVPSRDRVKKTVKFDGRAVAGETSLDLCSECAQEQAEGMDLRPLRRRRGQHPHPASPPHPDSPSSS